jgi:hypothetical protein
MLCYVMSLLCLCLLFCLPYGCDASLLWDAVVLLLLMNDILKSLSMKHETNKQTKTQNSEAQFDAILTRLNRLKSMFIESRNHQSISKMTYARKRK